MKNSIIRLFKEAGRNPIIDNLSPEERVALKTLKERETIVIQQADKGGKIVVMNREDYVQACQDMLDDTNFYKKETIDRHQENIDAVKNSINEMDDLITNKEKKYILEDV